MQASREVRPFCIHLTQGGFRGLLLPSSVASISFYARRLLAIGHLCGAFLASIYIVVSPLNCSKSLSYSLTMSDAGRKSFTDKASEAVKPDSQKGYLEKGKEVVTDKVDELAGKGTPEDQKGLGQSLADSAHQGKEDAKKEASSQPSLGETAQEYLEAAKEKASEAAEYVSQVVSGATEGAKNAADSTKK